uniref:Predicted nuclease, contains PIN domain, potential toxin-antitoxin system component n=1 Tax=Candidatus Kentrum sp. LPFa TaxID=2126335 RepID=A0A450XZ39_9GAMM|nr:MAG: Predicted nuclease, contains PIN domain, potential toxin-antitoxin system component [Candidatus Kentron sp. LPFa]VFK34550.1 MAG: Predicted nuclease, contains PIN domain, potential toxin-antitoxin system component [Candidatus Kentron sp. LPFa]
MKFVADESLDAGIVSRLRQDGRDVLDITEMAPGIPDTEVLRIANNHSALLLTADRDFGELVFRRHLISNGVILIRLPGISTKHKTKIVSSAIARHSGELRNSFVVITAGTIRIRRELP